LGRLPREDQGLFSKEGRREGLAEELVEKEVEW